MELASNSTLNTYATLSSLKNANLNNVSTFGIIDNLHLVISIATLFVGIITVCIAIIVYIKQKNIALLRHRLEILDVMDKITDELCLFGFTTKNYVIYNNVQVRVLFDCNVEELYKKIILSQKYCNSLFKGAKIADKEGNWMVPELNKYMTYEEIMHVISEESNKMRKFYDDKKSKICKKYIKI